MAPLEAPPVTGKLWGVYAGSVYACILCIDGTTVDNQDSIASNINVAIDKKLGDRLGLGHLYCGILSHRKGGKHCA